MENFFAHIAETWEWMAWTWPTMIFFLVIIFSLFGMVIWEIKSPTGNRQGFLPMKTTRGDRFFVGLLGSAFIHMAWIGVSDLNPWGALICSGIYFFIMMKWG